MKAKFKDENIILWRGLYDMSMIFLLSLKNFILSHFSFIVLFLVIDLVVNIECTNMYKLFYQATLIATAIFDFTLIIAYHFIIVVPFPKLFRILKIRHSIGLEKRIKQMNLVAGFTLLCILSFLLTMALFINYQQHTINNDFARLSYDPILGCFMFLSAALVLYLVFQTVMVEHAYKSWTLK